MTLFSEGALKQEVHPNRLLYGDNLTIMRQMPSASIDLIYLDPPFNSQRNYNLIYKQMTGLPVPEQEEAFCDAWELDAEKDEMARNMPIVLREYGLHDDLVVFWEAWIRALRNTQPRLLAYLVYMSYRLLEMWRLLKPTGSLYLHCDPTASHYIKVIMDGIFGHQNFRNEIVWKRSSSHNRARRWGPVHDVILFYTKGPRYTWNRVLQAYDQDYLDGFYRHRDDHGRFRLSDLTGPGTREGDSGQPWKGVDPAEVGRHWEPPHDRALPAWFRFPEGWASMKPRERLDFLDEQGLIYWPDKDGGKPQFKRYLDPKGGVPVQDVILDIKPVSGHERLGYPTQKPKALLKRIIQSSSNEGDVIFDPFCGCGTAIYAAHELARRWVGCDIAILSVKLVRDVLHKRYGLRAGEHYILDGVPTSVEGARLLFEQDSTQFQHWAIELAGGFCNTRRSGDRGVDGRLYYETSDGLRSMVLSVKGGKVTPAHIRELRGTLERESNADLAGFICLNEPTKGMLEEAVAAGFFHLNGKSYPRLQIRTIEDLLAGKAFETPSPVQPLNWERQGKLAI